MALRPAKLMICALGLGIMLTPNAEAANKNNRKTVAPQATAANASPTCSIAARSTTAPIISAAIPIRSFVP